MICFRVLFCTVDPMFRWVWRPSWASHLSGWDNLRETRWQSLFQKHWRHIMWHQRKLVSYALTYFLVFVLVVVTFGINSSSALCLFESRVTNLSVVWQPCRTVPRSVSMQNFPCYNSGPPPTLETTLLLLHLCEYCKTIHDLEFGYVYLSNSSPFILLKLAQNEGGQDKNT